MLFGMSFEVIPDAEKVFTIDGVHITNHLLLGWVVSRLLVITFIMVARRIKVTASGKVLSVFDILPEFITNLAADVMRDRKVAVSYAPFLTALCGFIIFNNWLGLLPGVGRLQWSGVRVFRPYVSDLPGKLAVAVDSVAVAELCTIR